MGEAVDVGGEVNVGFGITVDLGKGSKVGAGILVDVGIGVELWQALRKSMVIIKITAN